ncbi:hypothetical protein DVK02_14780 [Halobellus sp. Atlit-31R]|nr:hypothetical protein DVK02_14780 [Halobellus sp. Atlit-31R]
MSRLASIRRERDRINVPLFAAGALTALASAAGAALMLSHGDIVTALGLGLMIAAGALMSGIGLSTDASL